MSEEYLEHHGVIGMKWGVRKEERSSTLKKAMDGLSKKIKAEGPGLAIKDTKLVGPNAGKSKSSLKLQKAKAKYLINQRKEKAKLYKKGITPSDVKANKTQEQIDAEVRNAVLTRIAGGSQYSHFNSAKSMSDADLTTAIVRLENERRYVSLQTAANEANKSGAAKFIDSAKRAALAGVGGAITEGTKKMLVNAMASNSQQNSQPNPVQQNSPSNQTVSSISNKSILKTGKDLISDFGDISLAYVADEYETNTNPNYVPKHMKK